MNLLISPPLTDTGCVYLTNRDSRPLPPLFKNCTLILPCECSVSHASPFCHIMDKNGKKRKRSEDFHAEPTAKRVAAESSAKTINVSIASNDGEWGPILGM